MRGPGREGAVLYANMPNRAPESIAAVDVGSNSFHLVVAIPANGHFKVVDRLREVVRLGAGFDAQGRLSDEAITRALACLQRFGDRIGHLPPGAVRAVGTNALRKARNAAGFLRAAEAALGHPIDVVSGFEEARLIYLGVSHGLEDAADLRLVMDIGGGSTELVLGRRFEPLAMESLHMGCVSMSQAFFPDGTIDHKRLRAAEIAASQEFEPIEEAFRDAGWQSAIGSSSTLLAVSAVVATQGWSKDAITRDSLRRLREAVIAIGRADGLSELGIAADRRPVFPGGLAIALAAFEALGIERMHVSDSAMREGLLYDLLGRLHDEDVRERTVEHLMERFAVDRAQVARVAATADALLAGTSAAWDLAGEDCARLLRWAASVHEIGTTISHSQYQKHGAYLLHNLDMPGFSRGEQRRLATLVRGHRRKIPVAEFGTSGEAPMQRLLRLCVLLRLAVVLHRARTAEPLPPIEASADGKTVRLAFPKIWLASHPLAAADLEQEAEYLKQIGYKLKLR